MSDTILLKHLHQMVAEDPNGAEAEQLLRRLTVFPGTFDADAAAALAPRDMPEPVTLAALITLQQWGLLGRVCVPQPLPIEAGVLEAIPPQAETFATLQAWGFLDRETMPTRYFLLKSVLRALPPDEDALTRQYEYYRRLHGNLTTSVRHERYPLITADWPNIHAALTWGMNHAPKTVFDFAWALNFYMRDCLALADWRAIIQSLLRVAQEKHNLPEQGNALTTIGTIAQRENDLETAAGAYNEAITCYEQIDTTRAGQGLNAKVIEDLVELDARYETARDLYNHLIERPNVRRAELQQLIALYHLHDIRVKQGDFAEARNILAQMMGMYQHLRDECGQCNTLTNMGVNAAQAGDMAQAHDDFAWALRMSESIGYSIGQMKALWSWGQAEYQRGHKEAGCALCWQAVVTVSQRSTDYPRADELRLLLAEMDCGADRDGA